MAGPSFRAGVVIAIRDSKGRVMAFERTSPRGQWQLPQGGIDKDETAQAAAWRELAEETGLGPVDVRLVGEHPHWTVYCWPDGYSKKGRIGQAHRWFFFELHDESTEPTPDQREFCDWKWMSVDDLIEQVVEFRREPYRQVLVDG